MQERREMTIRVMEENRRPPLLKALGRNMIPVPTKALIRVKKDFTSPASPFLVAFEDFLRPRSGLLSPSTEMG